MLQIDQNRKRYEMIGKILAIGFIGFLVSPIIVSTVTGIAGLAIALALAYSSIKFAPVFGNFVANMVLKAHKYEASKRPIETLQNDYAYRVARLADYKKRIEQAIGEVSLFKSKLADFAKKFPDQTAMFEEQYAKAYKLVQYRVKSYEEGQRGLVQYKAEIEKATAFWELAQSAIAMNKAAEVDASEVIREIQTKTAVDAVQKSLYSSFAAIEMSLADNNAQFDVVQDKKGAAKVTTTKTKVIKNVTPIEEEVRGVQPETLTINIGDLSDRL